jgi:hypothetical protein
MRRSDADPGALSDQLFMSPSDYLLNKFQGDAMQQHYKQVDDLLTEWNAVPASQLKVANVNPKTAPNIFCLCACVCNLWQPNL